MPAPLVAAAGIKGSQEAYKFTTKTGKWKEPKFSHNPGRPPKDWFVKMYRRISANPKYRGYSKKRKAKIVAGIWHKHYSKRTKQKLTAKEGNPHNKKLIFIPHGKGSHQRVKDLLGVGFKIKSEDVRGLYLKKVDYG
jgi:hypothetical protein